MKEKTTLGPRLLTVEVMVHGPDGMTLAQEAAARRVLLAAWRVGSEVAQEAMKIGLRQQAHLPEEMVEQFVFEFEPDR